ncbi:hypothetical protein JXB02_02230 [Candidatus Woesearchaeota archaeon]|nr:hypothetical protein [Candidatus Woesearchaeota archaeon]
MASKLEFFIPLWYAVRREVLRFGLTNLSSSIRYFSLLVLMYLWVPAYALLVGQTYAEALIYVRLAIGILTFAVLYEAGYIFTDTIGSRLEWRDAMNTVYQEEIPLWLSIAGICIRIALVGIVMVGLRGWFPRAMQAYYLIVLLIFFIHGCLNGALRVVTFFTLRVLKGYAPYAWLFSTLPAYHASLVITALCGVSAFYTIEYGTRKLGFPLRKNLYDERHSYFRFVLVLCFTLTGVFLLDVPLSAFLVFMLVYSIHHLLLSSTKRLKRSASG